jgi:hypothetical protein
VDEWCGLIGIENYVDLIWIILAGHTSYVDKTTYISVQCDRFISMYTAFSILNMFRSNRPFSEGR